MNGQLQMLDSRQGGGDNMAPRPQQQSRPAPQQQQYAQQPAQQQPAQQPPAQQMPDYDSFDDDIPF